MRTLITALIFTLIASMPARGDDLVRLLGVIVGGAIVLESIRPQNNATGYQVQPHSHTRGSNNPRAVCYVETVHERYHSTVIRRNCWGDVVRIEILPR